MLKKYHDAVDAVVRRKLKISKTLTLSMDKSNDRGGQPGMNCMVINEESEVFLLGTVHFGL